MVSSCPLFMTQQVIKPANLVRHWPDRTRTSRQVKVYPDKQKRESQTNSARDVIGMTIVSFMPKSKILKDARYTRVFPFLCETF